MAWCEENDVRYVLGLAKNSRLKAEIEEELGQAEEQYKETVAPQLMKELGVSNVMEVPRITKITVNMGEPRLEPRNVPFDAPLRAATGYDLPVVAAPDGLDLILLGVDPASFDGTDVVLKDAQGNAISPVTVSMISAEARPPLTAVLMIPVPRGLVSTRRSPGRASALVVILSGWTSPTATIPYFGSGSSIV